MGRKQVLLMPNHNAKFVAGVAFDDETVQAGVMNLQPAMRHQLSDPARLQGKQADLIRQLVACTRRAIKQSGVTETELLGIGIADPGLVDSRSGRTVLSTTIPFWKDVPLKAIFESEFKVPVFLESSTRTKALAERILGAGQMSPSMLYVDYGAGIGAGIVIDGKLLLGRNGAAGEFGHTHVVDGGPVCSCGSYGCLEALVGVRAISAKLRKALDEGGYSSAVELAGSREKLTGWTVFQAAHVGDKLCSHIVAELASYLGLGLSNLINLFNPEVIVLDQRLALAGPELLDNLLQTVRRQSIAYSSANLDIRYGRFGSEGSLIGAGVVVIEDHFEIPSLKPPRFLIEPNIARAN